MATIRVDVVIEEDGKLTVRDLPVHKGDRVEAIVMLPDSVADDERAAARQRLLDKSRKSTFRSTGPYPTRDELHERS
jgi:hypothetical protein